VYKKEYSIWVDMLRRCYNKTRKDYRWYGEKGVVVDNKWHNFSNFVLDISYIKGYDKNLLKDGLLELDKDLSQSDIYSLNTCVFITKNINHNEMMSRVQFKEFLATHIETNNTIKCNNASEFARNNNLSRSAVSSCLNGRRDKHKGWIFKYII
jgi:hypothetical protein